MKNFILIVFLLISNCLFSQSIVVKGSWIWPPQINWISDLTEAGNDYIGTYESDLNETEISLDSGQGNRKRWLVVNIHKEINPSDWHPNLELQLRRTSGGTNSNFNIYNGESFQTVTDNYSFFFNTYGDQDNVPIQYKINGISVLLPVQDYTATVVFTVFEN